MDNKTGSFSQESLESLNQNATNSPNGKNNDSENNSTVLIIGGAGLFIIAIILVLYFFVFNSSDYVSGISSEEKDIAKREKELDLKEKELKLIENEQKLKINDNKSQIENKSVDKIYPTAEVDDPDGYTNIRSGKGTGFNILGIVKVGEIFYILNNKSSW